MNAAPPRVTRRSADAGTVGVETAWASYWHTATGKPLRLGSRRTSTLT